MNYSHIHKHSNSKERKKERKLQEPISLIFTSTYVIHRSHRWLQRWKNMSNCNVMCEYRKYSYHELHTNEPLHLRVQYGNCPLLPSCFPVLHKVKSPVPVLQKKKKKREERSKRKSKIINQHSLPSLLFSIQIRSLPCAVLSNPQQLMQVLTNHNSSTNKSNQMK